MKKGSGNENATTLIKAISPTNFERNLFLAPKRLQGSYRDCLLRKRFGEHRRAVTANNANQPAARHFISGSHNISDMKIEIQGLNSRK